MRWKAPTWCFSLASALALPGEDFPLSFSVPNFYVHITRAYDLLRLRGMPLAKRDYLGRLRLKD